MTSDKKRSPTSVAYRLGTPEYERHLVRYFDQSNYDKNPGGIPFVLARDVPVLNAYCESIVKVIKHDNGCNQLTVQCVTESCSEPRWIEGRHLVKPPGKDPHAYEKRILMQLQTQLAQILAECGQESIPVRVDVFQFNLARVEKTNGHPRADFVFITPRGTDILYMSHKAPKHQQHSGVIRDFPNHPETLSFYQEVKVRKPDGFKTKEKKLLRPVQDRMLAGAALFGAHFGQKLFGASNCNCFAVGELVLQEAEDGVYELKADEYLVNRGVETNVPEMVFSARYDSDRETSEIPCCRIGLFERSKVKGVYI